MRAVQFRLTPSISHAQVRKSPDVPQPHTITHHWQHVVQFGPPSPPLLRLWLVSLGGRGLVVLEGGVLYRTLAVQLHLSVEMKKRQRVKFECVVFFYCAFMCIYVCVHECVSGRWWMGRVCVTVAFDTSRFPVQGEVNGQVGNSTLGFTIFLFSSRQFRYKS